MSNKINALFEIPDINEIDKRILCELKSKLKDAADIINTNIKDENTKTMLLNKLKEVYLMSYCEICEKQFWNFSDKPKSRKIATRLF